MHSNCVVCSWNQGPHLKLHCVPRNMLHHGGHCKARHINKSNHTIKVTHAHFKTLLKESRVTNKNITYRDDLILLLV